MEFEEGSLEKQIVDGMFRYVSMSMGDAVYDIYQVMGLHVQGELRLNYVSEAVEFVADYMRRNGWDTIPYVPQAFNFNNN